MDQHKVAGHPRLGARHAAANKRAAFPPRLLSVDDWAMCGGHGKRKGRTGDSPPARQAGTAAELTRTYQWQRILDIQEIQMELMQDIAKTNAAEADRRNL